MRFQQFKKDGNALTLMLFDIDNFKSINDNHGHACGDKYLKLVAQSVKKRLREKDLIFRYGGDEFIILYDGLKIENAETVANNIMNNIHSINELCKNETVNVSISIGISKFEENDENIQDILNRMDQALYQAKKNGKDQAVLFTK